MNLDGRILDLLTVEPGLRASQIASRLGVDKSAANSTLYANKKLFHKDSSHKWFLAKVIGKSKGIQEHAGVGSETSHPLLSKLCAYYLDCLATLIDDDQAATWAWSKFPSGPDHVPLNSVPTIAGSTIAPETAARLRDLARFKKQREGSASLRIGWPTVLRKFRTRHGDTTGKVIPLLSWRVELNGDELRAIDSIPEAAAGAIASILNLEPSEAQRQTLILESELGFDSPECDVSEALEQLRFLKPEWPWCGDWTNPVGSGPHAFDASMEDGVYDTVIAWASTESKYTVGLRHELDQLRQVPSSSLVGTALGAWLEGETSAISPSLDAVLEVLPMNSEQRDAVRLALGSPLTVVTGPPGTGKSQLVTNLIFNASWHGLSALVASKNNKAVDVVVARANSVAESQSIIRMGSGYDAAIGAAITRLQQTVSTADTLAAYESSNRSLTLLFEERQEEAAKLLLLTKALNELKEREPLRETALRNLTPIVLERAAIESLPPMDLVAAKRALDELAPRQGMISQVLACVFRRSREQRAIAQFRSLDTVCAWLGLAPLKSESFRTKVDEANDLLAQIENRSKFAEIYRDYCQCKERLQKLGGIEDLAKRLQQLDAKIALQSGAVWQLFQRCNPALSAPGAKRTLSELSIALSAAANSGREGIVASKLKSALLKRFKELLKFVPGWAITSLSTKGRVPFEPGIFDLVVIDEASQCDLASALPLLYRAKKSIIIGDEMQLKHIVAMNTERSLQLMEKHGLTADDVAWSYVNASLFGRAQALADEDARVSLVDHHRSDASIIGFSNHHFYGGCLRVATRHDVLRPPSKNGPAFRWVDVRGRCERPRTGSAINAIEADAVVSELRRIILDNQYLGTVGVVTPFRAQATRLRELIAKDEALTARAAATQLLVDTVDRFQGDERDTILFSTVVADGAPASTIGFLASEANRFNVAVTRARAALIVVGDQAYARSCNASHLHALAWYDGKPPADPVFSVGDAYVSEWETMLQAELARNGIASSAQHPVERFRLDLAVFKGEGRLDIEVDGEQHRSWTGDRVLRDVMRDQRMIELGWDVARFWVYEIRDDLPGCVARVQSWLSRQN